MMMFPISINTLKVVGSQRHDSTKKKQKLRMKSFGISELKISQFMELDTYQSRVANNKQQWSRKCVVLCLVNSFIEMIWIQII
ncbi:unnamed protein product [Paramecium octaurelia]|uniref:Uncharacterized protein n=1 Tax=Paramecium octaurelia TaxID=43137 RepID=A0A8S1YNP7_PAROT|nr:unnamed protein product [Paramecium octaurelia]